MTTIISPTIPASREDIATAKYDQQSEAQKVGYIFRRTADGNVSQICGVWRVKMYQLTCDQW